MLFNPTMYFIWSLVVRAMLFPIVLPVRIYEEYKEITGV